MTIELDELIAENRRLREELGAHELRQKLIVAPLPFIWRAFWGAPFCRAVASIRETLRSRQRPTDLQWLDLAEAAFRRFVRISLVGLFVAVLPAGILAIQTALLYQQNSFIREANRFNIEARDVEPQVRVRVDRQTCTVVNTGRFPIHDVRVYRDDRVVNETVPHVAMAGFNPASIASAADEVFPSIAPGAQHKFPLSKQKFLDDDCASLDDAPGCSQGDVCPYWTTCHVIFHRDGDRIPYVAKQIARPRVNDGKCEFENLNRRLLESIPDPEARRWLEVMNKMDVVDKQLEPMVLRSEEYWGTETRRLEK